MKTNRALRLSGVKGIIFDYGGTLDTAGNHWGRILWEAYQTQAIPINETQFRSAYIYAERTLGRAPIIQSSYTFYETLSIKIRIEMEQLCASGAWNAQEKEIENAQKAILTDLYAQVKQTTQHSRTILQELKQNYPLVLVSNFYGNINEVLTEFGLNGFFDTIIESAVVGIRKPDPRIFSLGVEALGAEACKIVVIGDSFRKDIEPAIKAGCKTIWFKGKDWEQQNYDERIPDLIISDLDQLFV